MNKHILTFLFIVIACSARAQCLTSSLTINTGYNPVTNTAITPGTNAGTPVTDPFWILTAVSPGTTAAIAGTPTPGLIPVAVGAKADIVQPVGSAWVSNPPGNPGGWINCLNSNTYNDPANGIPLTMTMGRPFRLCTDDSVRITVYISSDNLTTAADVDGTITLPAPVTGFSSYTFYTQTVWLTAGTHTFNIVVANQNVASPTSNPMGLNVYGTVASASGLNSLVSESYASCATYNCGSTCNTVSLPDSLHLCQGEKDTLRGVLTGSDPVLNISWSPITGLNNSSILRPELTTGTTSGYYYLTVQSLIPYSLVNNGDFNLGNTGFSSTYTYVSGANSLQPEATYAVTTNPRNVHNSATSFTNHTATGGNMMVINGSSTPTSFWCQTIPVTPNTDYAFSAWVANWSAASAGTAPILQFQINGVLIGSAITLTSAPGVWVNFYATWNSGSNTSANICIYDACTALGGNDFVLDDISFQKLCISRDSIYVDVQIFDTTYMRQDTTVCTGVPVNLRAPAGYSPYVWNTGATGINFTAATAGTYWVYAGSHCATLIDTFVVNYKPIPPAPATRDTFYCRGFGGAAPMDVQVSNYTGTLNWYYTSGAPYGSTPTPSTADVNDPIGETYAVSQTINGCESPTANVTARIVAVPKFEIAARPWVCRFDSIKLAYSGAQLINGSFLWVLPAGASFVQGSKNTDSMVYVKFDSVGHENNVYLTASNLFSGQCDSTVSLTIDVIALPTASSTTKREVCLGDTVTLALASKSNNATDFAWFIDNSPLFSSPIINIVSGNSNNGGPYKLSWLTTGKHFINLQSFTIQGCTDRPVPDTVNVRNVPEARFTVQLPNGTLCVEDSVLFVANDSNYQDQYKWTPEHYFRNVDKRSVWGRVEESNSVVTLTVTDPLGCVATATKTFNPEACCIVPFPNAFTPNGDGLNDVFRPIPMRVFHRFHMLRIANRWGQTVFSSTDNKAEWDGTVNGNPQDVGVYYYFVKYDCDGKTLEEKGDVILIR